MAQLYPNHKVFSFPHNRGLSLSYLELKQRADVISQNLLEMGFQKGDRLAVILPNTAETVLLFLAAAQIGLITVIMSPAYQLVEVEFMLKKTGAKGVVFYDSFRVLQHLEIMNKICPELSASEPGKLKSERLPDLRHVFVVNSPLMPEKKAYKGTWSFDQLAAKKSYSNPIEFPIVEMDDPCLILFTVGHLSSPHLFPRAPDDRFRSCQLAEWYNWKAQGRHLGPLWPHQQRPSQLVHVRKGSRKQQHLLANVS